MQRVAVFGASGPIGQAQVKELLKRGIDTVAITRNGSILSRPEFLGAEIRPADYFDPDSLTKALAGVESVFFQPPGLLSPTSWAQPAGNVCSAAVKAGVKRLILNSTQWAPDAGTLSGQPTYDATSAMEDLFASSGLELVVFRPVLYMENLLTLFWKPPIVEEGVYRYCHRPGMEANWICMDDVAQFMVAGLTRDELTGRRFTLGGPERLPIEEVVQVLSAVMGRPLKFEYMPPREFGHYIVKRLTADIGAERATSIMGNDPGGLAEFLHEFYEFNNYSPMRPFEVDMTKVLKIIPIELTTLRKWAGKQDWTSAYPKIRSGTRIL